MSSYNPGTICGPCQRALFDQQYLANPERQGIYGIRQLLQFADSVQMPRPALLPVLLAQTLAARLAEHGYRSWFPPGRGWATCHYTGQTRAEAARVIARLPVPGHPQIQAIFSRTLIATWDGIDGGHHDGKETEGEHPAAGVICRWTGRCASTAASRICWRSWPSDWVSTRWTVGQIAGNYHTTATTTILRRLDASRRRNDTSTRPAPSLLPCRPPHNRKLPPRHAPTGRGCCPGPCHAGRGTACT